MQANIGANMLNDLRAFGTFVILWGVAWLAWLIIANW